LKPLSQCASSIFSGPFGSNLLENEYSENGLIIARPVNLTTSFEKDNLVTIDPELAKSKGLKEIDRRTLLFARVGDPAVGILPPSIPRATLSPNIIAAQAKEEEDLEFLFAFFSTSTALQLLNAAIKRVTQPTIGVDDISELEVLSPHKKLRTAIGNKVRAAEILRLRAESLWKEAVDSVEKMINGDLDEAACLEAGRKLADEFGLEKP
jgi:restriction endonuclease S subunit